jgi:hypothetical protein
MVAKGEPTPVVPRCEGLPNGSEHRSNGQGHELRPGVSLRVFTVRDEEGWLWSLRGSLRRDQESPPKGPGQNAENRTFAM